MNKEYKIDLTPYRGLNSTSLTGRPQGKKVRVVLNLDKLEKEYNLFLVNIPLGTTSFNPSFFLGLFYNSIKKLKSIEKFKEKFLFIFHKDENEVLKSIIEDNIDEALIYAKNSLEDSNNGFRF